MLPARFAMLRTAEARSRSCRRSRRRTRPGNRISNRCSLRSPDSPLVWLVRKEWRELMASRAWWVMLAAIGPLVGVSFISAVRTYAEASGLGGTAAGVGEAFSPLIGVWAPTFSACELAAAFLLPFVGIRLVAGDAQSGALKLELQQRLSTRVRVI